VFGVRVHRDRARVIELGAGGARGRGDGVLEGGGVGAGLAGLVVAGGVVGDGVEAVAAIDGVVAFVDWHGVVEAGAAVAVGVRQGEAAVAGLLDIEVDGADAASGGLVGRVRVNGDRAGIVEVGRGGGRARRLGVGLDGEV